MRLLFIFILLILICGGVYRVFGTAPTTPKILFTSTRDGNREVYMMNPDGSEQVNLTQHPADDLNAAWSPTGDKILFVSDRQGTRVRDLYVMDADGFNVRRVFKRKIMADRTNPAWAPDSKQFTYWSVDWNRLKFGLYLGTFGEEDAERIGNGISPAWAPDGSEIVCSLSRHPHEAQLTFIDVNTRTEEQPLSWKTLRRQYEPSWTATGDRLAFSGNRHPKPAILDRDLHDAWKDKQTIFIVNRDGTGLQQLVEEAGPAAHLPALSPDGSEVVWTQEINGRLQIFKIDVNTEVRTQLTHGGIFFQANADADWFDPAFALPVSPHPELLTTTWGEQKKE